MIHIPLTTQNRNSRYEIEVGRVRFLNEVSNLNIHLHCLAPRRRSFGRRRRAVFHEAAAPTGEELEALLAKVVTRVMRLLTSVGALIEEPDRTYLAETATDGALRAL